MTGKSTSHQQPQGSQGNFGQKDARKQEEGEQKMSHMGELSKESSSKGQNKSGEKK